MQGFFKTFADIDPQTPFDAAVVMPTTLRATLRDALASIFGQNFRGTIQVLIGIDTPKGDLAAIEAACALRPRNVAVHLFWPGYSTAARHGGVMKPGDGGALRSILTFLANSPYVAYLDDDKRPCTQSTAGLVGPESPETDAHRDCPGRLGVFATLVRPPGDSPADLRR
jgi:hypothetical protein